MNELLRSPRSPWMATPLIAVVTYTSLWAMAAMIVLGPWARTTALALAILTFVVMIARLASSSKVTPTITGMLVAVVVLVPIYAQDPEGHRYLLPSPSALTALFQSLGDGLDYAATATSPMVVDHAFGSLLTAGILGLFLAAEHVAVSWRAVASSGLVLFAPWIPAAVLAHQVSTTALLAGLAAWVAAMTLSRKNAPIERGISLTSAATATLASLALSGIAIPAALDSEGWGSIPPLNPSDLFDSTQLSLDLDLRNSLAENSDIPVLLYVSSGPRPDAFRLLTLTDFDGAGWNYEAPDPTDRSANSGLLWPESVPGWNESELVRLDVIVYSLVENHLPIPTTPRQVEVAGNWTYDSGSDTIIGNKESTENLTYTIVSDVSFYTAKALRDTDDLLAPSLGLDLIDPEYLEIPPTVDLANIRSVAEGLTNEEATRYDKTLAIQNYLRNPSIFTYSTSVETSSDDVVSDFLESKEGYCLQFATTMVVLLRSLGIPARMGYGFLAGEYDTSNGYVVRGRDAHVWPEVYFPGEGWARFEPTPSIQTGAPPSWADPFGSGIPVPREVLEGGGYPPGPLPEGPTNPENGPLTPDDTSPFLSTWAPWALGAVLATALFWVFLLWRRRTVAAVRAFHGPEGAWQRLADRLGTLAWPTSATPLEARSHVLRGIGRIAGRPPTKGSADALVSLSGAVSDHRYSPGGTLATQTQLDAWATEVITEAESATKEATGRPARGGVQTAPRGGS